MGHSRGLGYLAFTEAWERFSYYGMQTLLVLYMVNRLLHPGHIERIAGFVIAERAPALVRLEQPSAAGFLQLAVL
jgi:dipeptide/tripeptide permease